MKSLINKSDLENFKKKLVDEKKELEEELGEIGKKSGAGGNWQATSGGIDVDSADENELADKLEEIEGNSGIVSKLETQLNEVNAALGRIDAGTYGLCEVCKEPIETERLEANPSARTSIKHGH